MLPLDNLTKDFSMFIIEISNERFLQFNFHIIMNILRSYIKI